MREVDYSCHKIGVFMRWLVCFLSIFSVLNLSAKVRVITFHFNKPEFIQLQHRTLQKFLLNDYEMIVFNDAATEGNERKIREECERFGIQCIRFEPEWHWTNPLNTQVLEWLEKPVKCPHFPNVANSDVTLKDVAAQYSVRHCHQIQYALDHFGYDHNDVVVIMDGDAFLCREIDLREKLSHVDILGLGKNANNIHYLWVPFIAFNPTKLPDVTQLRFNLAVIGGFMHDTGAESYYYLKNHPKVKCRKVVPEYSKKYAKLSKNDLMLMGFREAEIKLIKSLPKTENIEFGVSRSVLHFGASSLELDGYEKKTRCMNEFLETILGE